MIYLLGLFGIYTLNSGCSEQEVASDGEKSKSIDNNKNRKLIANIFQVLKNKAFKSIILDETPKIKDN